MKTYIYQETTEWEEPNQPNHIYIFTEKPTGRSARCMGYVKSGTKSVFKFKKPYDIDLRGRKFEEVK